METSVTRRVPFPAPDSSDLSPYIPHSLCFSHLASCCRLNTPATFWAQNLEFSPDSGTAPSLTSLRSLLKSDLIGEHRPQKPGITAVLLSPHLLYHGAPRMQGSAPRQRPMIRKPAKTQSAFYHPHAPGILNNLGDGIPF